MFNVKFIPFENDKVNKKNLGPWGRSGVVCMPLLPVRSGSISREDDIKSIDDWQQVDMPISRFAPSLQPAKAFGLELLVSFFSPPNHSPVFERVGIVEGHVQCVSGTVAKVQSFTARFLAFQEVMDMEIRLGCL